jgi:hypothetical protein
MCHKKNNSLNNCDMYDQLINQSSLLSKTLDIGGQNYTINNTFGIT